MTTELKRWCIKDKNGGVVFPDLESENSSVHRSEQAVWNAFCYTYRSPGCEDKLQGQEAIRLYLKLSREGYRAVEKTYREVGEEKE